VSLWIIAIRSGFIHLRSDAGAFKELNEFVMLEVTDKNSKAEMPTTTASAMILALLIVLGF